MFEYFTSNQIFNKCQSELRKAQLLLCVTLGSNPSTDNRGVFLDISKEFDKLCLSEDSYLNSDHMVFFFYLTDTLGKSSRWNKASRVPEGSILGHLLLLIYTNNLAHCIGRTFLLMLSLHNQIETCETLNNDLSEINIWNYPILAVGLFIILLYMYILFIRPMFIRM